MRFLILLITFPILAVILSFTYSNQADVALGLWPWPEPFVVPAYLLGLVPLAVGILIGGYLSWLGQGRHRNRARVLAARVRNAEAEMVALRTSVSEARERESRRALEDERAAAETASRDLVAAQRAQLVEGPKAA